MISASGALSPGVIALQPFLRSPEYGEQARDVAVNLLGNSSDQAFFTSLFRTALTPVTWTNIDRTLRLDRTLAARVTPMWNKEWDTAKGESDPRRLTKDEQATVTYAEAVLPEITSHVGRVLKTQAPQRASVDLSATVFKTGDWKGVDLNGANLENIQLLWIDLHDAELAGVTQFSSAYLFRTAWWEAKSMNKPLLDYLTASFPFVPGVGYGPRDDTPSQESYNAAIRRLASQAK